MSLNNNPKLVNIVHHLITKNSDLKNIMEQFWLSPQQMEVRVQDSFAQSPCINNYELLISGETNNISLYMIGTSEVFVITPFSDVTKNVVLNDAEVIHKGFISADLHYAIVPKTAKIKARLRLPKVLLVNLSVIDNFPVPRLSLGVSSLTSYIRRKQRGIVSIIDMQIGLTVKDVVNSARSLAPDLIGISVSYGQKFLAFELLSALENTFCSTQRPILEAGNIIPASSPQEFLKQFPSLVISYGEGERTLLGLLQHLSEELPLDKVEGLIRLDESGQIIKTRLNPLPITDQPLPALDTLDELVIRRGALTLELSRGCQYNVCSFCPREHKAAKWKGLPAEEALQQLELMAKVMDRTNLPRRLFLADEEFVGDLPGDGATERIQAIAKGILQRQLNIQIDTEARVDQVYNPRKDKAWHICRMRMWRQLREAGLDRLFMGIESGSPSQLKRYAKGTTPEQAIIAVRILSALGVNIRSGFIMFDPLMVGLNDLKENIAFLETSDAFLRPVDLKDISFEILYESLLHNSDFVRQYSVGRPLYTVVSYMLASLEVLINSPYKGMVDKYERTHNVTLILDKNFPDTNMGRHHLRYVDEKIGVLSDKSQRWIDRNFALAYALKSFYKVAQYWERPNWMSHMIKLREFGHYLLKTMVFLLDEYPDEATFATLLNFHGAEFVKVQALKQQNQILSPQYLTTECLTLFEARLSLVVEEIESDIKNKAITDNAERRMEHVIKRWRDCMGDWSLINDPLRN